ncbi:MAG: hypothetical protein G01um101416_544 [Microgenomates group bacterium Gr01-1014_16]|nr:MAG: hypothetical protein G01um101416_544 [Microgenomates group bacterium Gr01-1014_16]
MAEGGLMYEKPRLKKISSPTHYQRLGITPTASKVEVGTGYKKMAVLVHPDKGNQLQQGVRTELMQQLNKARDELSDPIKKTQYDETLKRQESERLNKEREEARKRDEALRAERERMAREEEKRQSEERRRARQEEAERKRQQADAERKKREEEERVKKETEKQARLEKERKEAEKQAVLRREFEEAAKAKDEELRNRGYNTGVKLSSWLHTEDGKIKEKELKELLVWAAKMKEGITSFLESNAGRESRVNSLIMGMTTSDSLRTWGYGADLAGHIRAKWKKEGLTEQQVEEKFTQIEQDLRELAHARHYENEPEYRKDGAIPVNLGSDSHTGRWDYGPNGNKTLYDKAFKEGWENVKARVLV